MPPSMCDAWSGATTKQRMRFSRQRRGIELIQLGKHERRVANRVDSYVVSAAVRRAPDEFHLDPHETAMRGTDCKACGLRDDCAFGNETAGHERAHSDARILLVRRQRDDDLTSGPGAGSVRRACRRDAHRRRTRLHVGGPSPVDPAVADVGVEWRVRHSIDVHDIEVPGEHQGRRVRRTKTSNETGAARRGVRQLGGKSPVADDPSQVLCDRGLTGSAGYERWIA